MSFPSLVLEPHLSPDVIAKRYFDCKGSSTERSRWHALYLLSREDGPLGSAAVANVIGYGDDWVRRTARRYNKDGAAGLEDKRKENGNKKILSTAKQKKLKACLKKRPVDGGLWSGPKVAQWMQKELKQPVSAVTGWHYLGYMELSLQVPRPHHVKGATKAQQRAFKKNSLRRLKSSKRSTPTKL